MDHVSVDEGTKIEASVNNSFGSCQQPQGKKKLQCNIIFIIFCISYFILIL